MAHQGRVFEAMVTQDPREITEIAKKIGRERQAIYRWYKVKEFNKSQLASIAKVGYDINKITDNSHEAIIIDNSVQVKRLEKTVKDLEETIDVIQEDSIELNKKFNNLYRDYLNLLDIATKLQNEVKRINHKWRMHEEVGKKVLVAKKS